MDQMVLRQTLRQVCAMITGTYKKWLKIGEIWPLIVQMVKITVKYQ